MWLIPPATWSTTMCTRRAIACRTFAAEQEVCRLRSKRPLWVRRPTGFFSALASQSLLVRRERLSRSGVRLGRRWGNTFDTIGHREISGAPRSGRAQCPYPLAAWWNACPWQTNACLDGERVLPQNMCASPRTRKW
jgi:hypothetical protein